MKLTKVIDESNSNQTHLFNLDPKVKFLWEWYESQLDPKKIVELIKKEGDEMKANFVKQFREMSNQAKQVVVDQFKKFTPIQNGNCSDIMDYLNKLDKKLFVVQREMNEVVKRSTENTLEIVEINGRNVDDKQYLFDQIELNKNLINDSITSNVESIDDKISNLTIQSDALDNRINDINTQNLNFRIEVNSIFDISKGTHNDLKENYNLQKENNESKIKQQDEQINNLVNKNEQIYVEIEKLWDKILSKIGQIQLELSEKIEFAKMQKGIRSGPKNEEPDTPAKIDDKDLSKKLKELDLNTLLGLDKFKDSIDFDIRMLKDEYLEFKGKFEQKQNKFDTLSGNLESDVKELKVKIEEICEGNVNIKISNLNQVNNNVNNNQSNNNENINMNDNIKKNDNEIHSSMSKDHLQIIIPNGRRTPVMSNFSPVHDTNTHKNIMLNTNPSNNLDADHSNLDPNAQSADKANIFKEINNVYKVIQGNQIEFQSFNEKFIRIQDIVDILHKSWKLNSQKIEDIEMKVKPSKDLNQNNKGKRDNQFKKQQNQSKSPEKKEESPRMRLDSLKYTRDYMSLNLDSLRDIKQNNDLNGGLKNASLIDEFLDAKDFMQKVPTTKYRKKLDQSLSFANTKTAKQDRQKRIKTE